jgi:ABC-type amino acid transport substrate-binding protein
MRFGYHRNPNCVAAEYTIDDSVHSGRPVKSRAKRLSRVPLASVTLLGALVAIAGCGTTSSASTTSAFHLVTPGTLTVGVYEVYRPMVLLPGAGKLGGINGFWINQFAKQYHLKVDVYETTFASDILAVEEHKVDVALNYYYTPQRAKSVYYTAPFDTEGVEVFTRSSFHYSGPASFNGQKVATVVGFAWNSALQSHFGANLVQYPSEAEAETAVTNGDVAGFFDGDLTYLDPPWNGTKSIRPHKIKIGQFGMSNALINVHDINIVSCKAKALATHMDAVLRKLTASGAWKKEMRHYFKTGPLPITAPTPPQELC